MKVNPETGEDCITCSERHKADLAIAQAQVAVMSLVLQRIRDKSRFNLPGTIAEINRLAEDALSAAPKVVCSIKGKLLDMHDKRGGYKGFFPDNQELAAGLVITRYPLRDATMAKATTLIVLDKGEGE